MGQRVFRTAFLLPPSMANDPALIRHCAAIARASQAQFGGQPAGGTHGTTDTGLPCFRLSTTYTTSADRAACVLWEECAEVWLRHVILNASAPSQDYVKSAGLLLLPHFADLVGRAIAGR